MERVKRQLKTLDGGHAEIKREFGDKTHIQLENVTLFPPHHLLLSRPKNLLEHFLRYAFDRRQHKHDHTPQSRDVLLLHKSHQCKHHFCVGSKEFRLSPCWTWQKRIQSSQPCSTAYIDLPLEAKRSKEVMVKRKS